MNRSAALRTFFIFLTVTALAALTGIASGAEIAEVVFLIGGSLAALMFVLSQAAAPRPMPVPVRVRQRR